MVINLRYGKSTNICREAEIDQGDKTSSKGNEAYKVRQKERARCT